jgi:hypothetical protein
MEAKAKADQEAQAHLPPPPFRPLAEQSFMQYMQFMQETQNKFMQELMGQVGAGRVPEARGKSFRLPQCKTISLCFRSGAYGC